MGTEDSGLSGEATESQVLGLLVLVSEALNDLGGAVHVLGDVELGSEEAGLGGSGTLLLGTVNHLVLQEEGEGSLDLLAVNGLDAANSDGGGSAGGVVEAGLGKGVVGERVTVELDEVRVVLLGESPNNAVGGLHFLQAGTINTQSRRDGTRSNSNANLNREGSFSRILILSLTSIAY